MGQPALSLFRGDDDDPKRNPGQSGLSFVSLCDQYLDAKRAAPRTRDEYRTTCKRLGEWSSQILHRCVSPMQVSELSREVIKDFLDWVYAQAVSKGDKNPGRSANKRRDHLHSVLTWALAQELIESLPRFPEQRDTKEAAGLFYLNESELNALYWATHSMPRPHGWTLPLTIGTYWRAALTFWLTYGADTQTVFAYDWAALPLKWSDVYWDPVAPDRSIKHECEWGWLYYQRKKTGRRFMRPMSREVNLHLASIRPADGVGNSPDVFASAGGSRPCERFQELVALAKIENKLDFVTGAESKWTLKDLRKTCATWHEQHIPGSASAILGHAIGRGDGRAQVTYRHYANLSPLEFRAITSFPYPAAFRSIWDDQVQPPDGLLFVK